MDDAIIYVLDKKTREIIKIEEGYSSLIWTERYQKAGEFKLTLPVTVENYEIYRIGNYLSFGDSVESMIIETVDIDDQSESPEFKVSGRSLSAILDRRINASRIVDLQGGTITYQGDFESVISSIINNEVILPKIQTVSKAYKADGSYVLVKGTEEALYRMIPNCTYQNLVPDGYEIDRNYNEAKTVLELLEDMSKPNITGFRTIIDSNRNFVLQTYRGTDRTMNQSNEEPLIFSPAMENISYVNYYEDITDYKNACLVYVDKALEETKIKPDLDDGQVNPGYIWIPNSDNLNDSLPTGIDRFETAFDVRSEVSFEVNDDSDWTVSFNTMLLKLQIAGKDVLADGDYDYVKMSEGAVDSSVNYIFDEDYFLGDLVELTNDNGVVMTAIIDEVVRSYDENGYVVTPNFKSLEDYDYGDEDATS